MRELSREFALQRQDRQNRRELDPADFRRFSEAGFLLTAVPQRCGGLWIGVEGSTRPISEALRLLAHGDPSIALVASMHPAVLVTCGWLPEVAAPSEMQPAWKAQCEWAHQTAMDGHWWGTITSEPGSGGDIGKTRAVAIRRSSDGAYALTG